MTEPARTLKASSTTRVSEVMTPHLQTVTTETPFARAVPSPAGAWG